MIPQPDATIRTAAERAAAEVYEAVRTAALEAAQAAVQDALRALVGAEVDMPDVELKDRVTRTEAARRLGTTSQTIMRLERKGLVRTDKTDGRVYVHVSEVEDALARGGRIATRARLQRQATG